MTVISGLSVNASPLNEDLLYIVDDPSGSPQSNYATLLSTRQKVLLYDSTITALSHFEATGIDQGYDDLEIFIEAKSDTGTTDNFYIYFNDDVTAANYHTTRHYAGNGATHGVAEYSAPVFHIIGSSTAAASHFTPLRIWIPKYASAIYHSWRSSFESYYTNDGIYVTETGGAWEGSAIAITSIRFQPDGYPTDKLMPDSRIRILGVKYGN